MDNLRCIIVDDEQYACEILADDIRKIHSLQLVKVCNSTFEAIRLLEFIPVDLVFLDIQMPGLTGLQFLSQLPNPPLVIFTTGFQQFAVVAFELNAVDYLLKPFSFNRLLAAVDKAKSMHNVKYKKSSSLYDRSPALRVKSGYQTVIIPYDEILYIEGMKDYVRIFIKDKPNPITTRMNVKNIQSLLPDDIFCRVHQSYIVSIKKLRTFQKKKVWIGEMEIPIGDRFVTNFEKILGSEFWKTLDSRKLAKNIADF